MPINRKIPLWKVFLKQLKEYKMSYLDQLRKNRRERETFKMQKESLELKKKEINYGFWALIISGITFIVTNIYYILSLLLTFWRS
jgi:membrane protein YqaA with SNARE-associated domain